MNMKKIILISILLSLIVILIPSAFAADVNGTVNSTDNIDSSKISSSQNLNDSKVNDNSYSKTIFLISDNPGSNILDSASKDILSNKNYSNVKIIVRSGDQIKKMSNNEVIRLINNSDIFIGEWISSDVDAVLTSILQEHPELSNKEMFLILESPGSSTSSINLLYNNTINYEKILTNYTVDQLNTYFQKTKRGIRYSDLLDFLVNGSGNLFPTLFNKAVLYKNLNDKDNLKNQILWALNCTGYNTYFAEPNFTGKQTYGIYRERWWTLEEYMNVYFNSSRLYTVGIIESTMYVDSEQLQTYYALIESLEAKGFNVIPVVAYGATPEQLFVMLESFTNATDYNSFITNTSQYKIYIDALISMPAYGLGGSLFTKTTTFLEKLNVPVVRAIHSDYYTNEQWEMSESGLPNEGGSKWWHVTISEAQGIFASSFVGGMNKIISEFTGLAITGYDPNYKNIDLLTDRVLAWVLLGYTNNSDKKLSLVYYNYPPGKQNVASSSYLNTIESIYNLLYLLKEEGYDVGTLPKNVSELEDAMLLLGKNIASWAPGLVEEVADNPNAILMPVDEYLAWFNTLDDIVKLQVTEGPVAYIGELTKHAVEIKYTDTINSLLDNWYKGIIALLPENRSTEATPILVDIVKVLKIYATTENIEDYNSYLALKKKFLDLKIPGLNGWGQAPGDVMTVTRNGTQYYVIPGLKFGNIFVGPEPQRGWESEDNESEDFEDVHNGVHSGASALYHSTAVAPTHQYLAAYYYLQTYYSSAMVFMGRHGTHEFLPGKELLLSSNDFGSIVLGKTPQLYYYISDGLAEALQAKRRGYAVMISHLTSPMAHTKLYGNYIEMANLLAGYENAKNTNDKNIIINKIKEFYKNDTVKVEFGITNATLNNMTNEELIKFSNDRLFTIQSQLQPLGLHTIGTYWADNEIVSTVVAMLDRSFQYNSPLELLKIELANIIYSKDYSLLNTNESLLVENISLSIINSLNNKSISSIKDNISSTYGKNLSDFILVELYLYKISSGSSDFFDEISMLLYQKKYTDLNALKREEVLNYSYLLINSLINNTVEEGISNFSIKYNKNNISDYLIAYSYLAKEYMNLLNISIEEELKSLINGLEGKFIPPQIGGDPISNPSVLPTGNNFYQDQSSALPTKKAFAYGETLANLTLSGLDLSNEKIAMGIWCVETARDDGALVSAVLHLLGMKVEWTDSPSAGVDGANVKSMPVVVKVSDLIRPKGWENKRLDVVVITSGIFRDQYSSLTIILDNAFRLALACSYYTIIQNFDVKKFPTLEEDLNFIMEGINNNGLGYESLENNYVAKHWLEDYAYYLSQNYTGREAAEAAITRVFAPPSGDYGAGVSKMSQLSWTWDDRLEAGRFYLNRMANSYGKNSWGASDPKIFERALNKVDTIVASRNTNQYGVLDNDDFFDYWGGLSVAIESITNKTPNLNILSYANQDKPELVSLEEYITRESGSRYFSPDYIKAMMNEGYSGANKFSKFISNIWGWEVTRPNSINDDYWKNIIDVYINDKYNIGVYEFLSTGNNRYSKIAMEGTVLTAVYKGSLKLDSATFNKVVNDWAATISSAGVACCDCSCGNIQMLTWAMTYINPDLLSQFKQQMYKATLNKAFAPDSSNSSSNTNQNSSNTKTNDKKDPIKDSGKNSEMQSTNSSYDGSPVGSGASVSTIGGIGGAGEGDSNSYEITEKQNNSTQKVSMPIAAIICVIVLVALIGVGYFRNKNKNEEN